MKLKILFIMLFLLTLQYSCFNKINDSNIEFTNGDMANDKPYWTCDTNYITNEPPSGYVYHLVWQKNKDSVIVYVVWSETENSLSSFRLKSILVGSKISQDTIGIHFFGNTYINRKLDSNYKRLLSRKDIFDIWYKKRTYNNSNCKAKDSIIKEILSN